MQSAALNRLFELTEPRYPDSKIRITHTHTLSLSLSLNLSLSISLFLSLSLSLAPLNIKAQTLITQESGAKRA